MPPTMQDRLFQGLPAIYRQEGRAGFTYRLLGLFGEVLQEQEDHAYGLHRQLGALTADPEFLPWLATWVAFVLDETWDETTRRDLIRRIVQLYTVRGTVEGLREFVEIYTGIKPDIVEWFKAGWQIGVRSTVGVDTRIYGAWDDTAHRFSVIVKTFVEFTPEQKAKITERILIEKPAHTELVSVSFYASFWQIGVLSTLGVDTKVGG